uniref:Uncharacterized protein n=1 Tax=Arundo donax TaxID=35708 RepID=A0A0A9BUB2_ARUDO
MVWGALFASRGGGRLVEHLPRVPKRRVSGGDAASKTERSVTTPRGQASHLARGRSIRDSPSREVMAAAAMN